MLKTKLKDNGILKIKQQNLNELKATNRQIII
jgi:hypothetical protein